MGACGSKLQSQHSSPTEKSSLATPSDYPMFIESEDLQKLIGVGLTDLKIFDCTVVSKPEEDAIMLYHKEHI